MKKTKMLVATIAIVLGIGTAVQAKLPVNSIMVGSNVYDSGYLQNPGNLLKVNDELMNNLGSIYFVDNSGKAKDIFTGSLVEDSEIAAKVGNTLTYYTSQGTKQKIVTDANNEFTDPTNMNSNMSAVININYKPLTTGLFMYNIKITQLSGVNNGSYFKVGNSSITPLTDTATYMDVVGSGSNLLSIYASDGLTELANGSVDFKKNNAGGTLNLSVILNPTKNDNPIDETTHGNTAGNITNTGFAAIDGNNKWMYYQNTADGNKLYRKSVTGVDDYVISDDSVQYVNVVGDWVFYSNYKDGGKIYKVRLDGTQKQKICDDMASCINVVGSKIYYINNSDRGRIYVLDAQGRRQIIGDRAKLMGVGDTNYLFYINASDGNKLYSYDLLNNRKTKISDINTEFISVANDYSIFYTGKDGSLYRSTNSAGQNPIPMPIITNVPQKGGKDPNNMKGLTDKATIIYAKDDNNIYYKSYVDGGKIYKLDSTGNGYKVVDAPTDFINIAGDSLYYMKSGKLSVIPKDSDGTTKGTAVSKPKLDQKVVKVDPIPSFTTTDITTFNFPERVSCIMNDGTIRQLVVNWDTKIPKPQKGVYKFTGTILGYGAKVTMSVALDSGTLDASKVKVVNEIGSKDTVTVSGLDSKLDPGDIVSVYSNMGDKKPLKTAVVDKNGNASISGLNLNPDGGTVYVSITKKDKAEGSRVSVAVPAEAPTAFLVNAQSQEITGLKTGKQYKVYINDLSKDGSIPPLPSDFVNATADEKGVIKVINMQGKITGNADNKQMLRVVAVGNVDSMPSAPVQISKAKVEDYVSIDLNLGRILGTSAGMQYRYKDSEEWKDCQPGTTPISMTMSLEVQVKVKASGPVMESDAKKFGLFPMPVVTGIENGKIYAGKDSSGNSAFPDVTWNTDTGNITYKATLVKDGGASQDVTMANLKDKVKENGEYVLTVIGTKTDTNMTPSTATNSVSIKFTVNSVAPSKPDITITENKGTKPASGDPDTYYKATPTWINLAGTYSDAVIQRLDTMPTTGTTEEDKWITAAKVAFVRGNSVDQDGYYRLTVNSTSTENGAKTSVTKIFKVDTTNTAKVPSVDGAYEGGIYKNISAIKIKDGANCVTTATIMRDGYVTPYITPDASYVGNGSTELTGKELTVNGNYVLGLKTVNVINGHSVEKNITFTIEAAGNISEDIASGDVTIDNKTSPNTVVVNNIPFGTTIKVYSASGTEIGSQTNNAPLGPVTVTIPGGIPASDDFIYVTKTDAGKQESNKTKVTVTKVPSVKSVSPTVFKEAEANDGTVEGTIVVEIQNGTVKGNPNDVITVTPTNLPKGLTHKAVKLDDTHVGITISGKADNHTNANDTSELSFEILGDQVGGDASQKLNTGHITIDFNDPVELTTSPTTLTEAASNDGTVAGDIIVQIKNGTLVDPSVTDTNTDSTGYVSAVNLPKGLHYKIAKVDSTHLKISISGKADNHANANDVNNAGFTIDKSKVVGATQNLTTENITIDFKDPSTLTYSSDTFAEAAANDGSIGSPITITLAGDTLAGNVGDDFVSKGYVTISNVPGGLTAKVIKTSDSVLTVTLQGKAATHASANSITNLTINFNDSAFKNEPTSQISNSNRNDLKVTFTD